MDFAIAVIPGDGIGPDIVQETMKVMNAVGDMYGHRFSFTEADAGGCAIDACGEPLPQKTLELCRKSDSVLLGAVGGPKWDHVEGSQRPEMALLGLRSGLGLYANLRPAILYEQLKEACPLRSDIIGDGLDIMVVRELTGGIYFGDKGRSPVSSKENSESSSENSGGEEAYDTLSYTTAEIQRIARTAFDIAMKRGKKLTSVDKANILESSRLWRSTVDEIAREYPEVAVDHMYVDNAAMQLVRNPHQFDVILTTNMFGDILSDEASMITGSIGMLPSASLGTEQFGMYEPVHGSAPDIAGQDKANPIATVLSAAMMLRYSFNLTEEADAMEKAVQKVLEGPWRTGDIISKGKELVGTQKMGQLIMENLKRP